MLLKGKNKLKYQMSVASNHKNYSKPKPKKEITQIYSTVHQN